MHWRIISGELHYTIILERPYLWSMISN